MPKKNKEDKLEEEKKEFIDSVERLTKRGLIKESDVQKLMSLMDEVLEAKKEPLIKRIFKKLVSLLIYFSIMFLSVTAAFGLFFNALALDNKWFVFIVSAVISILLMFIHSLPWLGDVITKKHFLLKYIVVIVLFITVICLANSLLFRVFEFSIVWVFHIVISSILYMMIEYYLSKKFSF